MTPTATVILASRAPGVPELWTIHMRYWRAMHSEMLRHRALSSSVRSSRAVSAAKMRNEVRKRPAAPNDWRAETARMQAGQRLKMPVRKSADAVWHAAAEAAATYAEILSGLGVHHADANRLLEPFAVVDHLATGTRDAWEGMLALRDHPDADHSIQAVARAVRAAMELHEPTELPGHGWHLPFSPEGMPLERAQKISAGCCAHVSYSSRKRCPTIRRSDWRIG